MLLCEASALDKLTEILLVPRSIIKMVVADKNFHLLLGLAPLVLVWAELGIILVIEAVFVLLRVIVVLVRQGVTFVQTLRVEAFTELVLFCYRASAIITLLIVRENLIAGVHTWAVLIIQVVLLFHFSHENVLELDGLFDVGEIN